MAKTKKIAKKRQKAAPKSSPSIPPVSAAFHHEKSYDNLVENFHIDTNKKQESKAIGLSQDADVIYAAMKSARKKGAKSPTLDALSNEYQD